MSAELGEELQHGALRGSARGREGRGRGRRTLSTITHDARAPPESSSDLQLFVFIRLHKCDLQMNNRMSRCYEFVTQMNFQLSVRMDCVRMCQWLSVSVCVTH